MKDYAVAKKSIAKTSLAEVRATHSAGRYSLDSINYIGLS